MRFPKWGRWCAAAAVLAGIAAAGVLMSPSVTRGVSGGCPSKPVSRAGQSLIQAGPGALGSHLVCADLHGADLTQAEFPGVDLRGADLSHTELGQADLTGADLRGADLSHADLAQTNLTRADLRGANLDRADLTQAELAEADLRGASLWGVFAIQAEGTSSVRIDVINRGVIQVTYLLVPVAAVLLMVWWRRKLASLTGTGRRQTMSRRISQVMASCAAILVAVAGIYAFGSGVLRGMAYMLLPLWSADPGPLGSLGLGNLFSQIGAGLVIWVIGGRALAMLSRRVPGAGPEHGTPHAVPTDRVPLDVPADRPPADVSLDKRPHP